MKSIILAALLLAVVLSVGCASTATATIVRSELIGAHVWACTYQLGNYQTTVARARPCPVFLRVRYD
jgi:uncharacterized protein (DUF2062 family)